MWSAEYLPHINDVSVKPYWWKWAHTRTEENSDQGGNWKRFQRDCSPLGSHVARNEVALLRVTGYPAITLLDSPKKHMESYYCSIIKTAFSALLGVPLKTINRCESKDSLNDRWFFYSNFVIHGQWPPRGGWGAYLFHMICMCSTFSLPYVHKPASSNYSSTASFQLMSACIILCKLYFCENCSSKGMPWFLFL